MGIYFQLGIFLWTLSSLTSIAFASSRVVKLSDLGPDPCPSSSIEWDQWRTEKVESGLYSPSVPVVIAKTLQACLDDSIDPTVKSCLGNLQKYSEYVSRFERVSNEARGGFTLSDADYNARVRPIVTPEKEIESLNLAIRSAVFSQPDSLSHVQQAIDEINLKRKPEEKLIMAPFRGTVSAADDEKSFDRILIYDPKPIPRYMNFSLNDSKNVSVIAVNPSPSKNSEEHPVGIYFKDFTRHENGFKYKRAGQSSENVIQDNCTSCHVSGLLPISAPPKGFEKYESQRDLINQSMKKYSKLRPAFVDSELTGPEGPAVGPVEFANRTPEFIAKCSNISDLESQKRISKAMKCASCHNGNGLVKIVLPASKVVFDRYIEEGHMPPNSDLTKAEKRALINCLKEEYGYDTFSESEHSVLKQYFTQKACLQVPPLVNSANAALKKLNQDDAKKSCAKP